MPSVTLDPEHDTNAQPPSYNNVQSGQGREPIDGARRTFHQRSLETTKGRKWLTVFVSSRAPDGAALPVVFEGDQVAGKVEFDVDKPESIKGVTISIAASTTFVGQDEEVFYDAEQILWTSSGSKISGKHAWPFSFTLPTEVEVKEREGKKGTYRLPPSFMERASPAYIDYKLTVTVKRGMLRVNQTLMTNLAYLPMTYPDPPSHLRRMAYAEGSPLPGPEVDLEGWKVLPTVKVKGTLFSVKAVEVECKLAVGSPLSYAVGSPIPLFMTLNSEDTQALDVLASPTAIRIRLLRSMATGSDAVDDNGIRRTDNHFLEVAGQGYFWSLPGETPGPTERTLHGELEVARGLKPSFKFPKFTIRYTIQLLGFKAPGFVAEGLDVEDDILLSETVEVATKQFPGVVVHSYAPPGYERPQKANYNNSVGLLEIGNQRFVHYGHHHG